MRHRTLLLMLAGALFAGLSGMKSPAALAYNVEITPQQIETEVATLFPVRQQLPFMTTTFSNPRVRIVGDSDRVRLMLDVHARFIDQIDMAGQAEIEGSLGYDAASGEFHLIRPTVTGLRSDSLQQEALEMVRLMANAVAEQYLPSIVVYRLDDRDFKQGMMRRNLKSVQIRDGKLVAELDW